MRHGHPPAGGKWRYSLLRTFFIALSGAIVASFLLAYLSSLTGLDSAFDGGLGGDGGSAVIAWAQNLFGTVISGVLPGNPSGCLAVLLLPNSFNR